MQRHPEQQQPDDGPFRMANDEADTSANDPENEATTMIERLLRRAGGHAARAQHAEAAESVGPTVARALDLALEDLRRRIAVSADHD